MQEDVAKRLNETSNIGEVKAILNGKINKQTQRVKDQVVDDYIQNKDIQKYIVWEHNDPRKLGDNYSKVNKIVSFIGSEEEALKHYKQMKNAMKFAGSNCTSFSYPTELKDSETALRLGEEIIIHAEKHEPDDDDFAEQNAESDFFD